MSKDTNLATQETLGGILAAKDVSRLTEGFHRDVVDHDPAPDQAPGVEGIQQFWTEFFTASVCPELTSRAGGASRLPTRPATWSACSAMSGETTTVRPSRTAPATW